MSSKVNRSEPRGLFDRQAAFYKRLSTNPTKDKVLAIIRIRTQPTSCHLSTALHSYLPTPRLSLYPAHLQRNDHLPPRSSTAIVVSVGMEVTYLYNCKSTAG